MYIADQLRFIHPCKYFMDNHICRLGYGNKGHVGYASDCPQKVFCFEYTPIIK